MSPRALTLVFALPALTLAQPGVSTPTVTFETQTEAARCGAIAPETICFGYVKPSVDAPAGAIPSPAVVKLSGSAGTVTVQAATISPAGKQWLRVRKAGTAEFGASVNEALPVNLELGLDAAVVINLPPGRFVGTLTAGGVKLPVQLTVTGAGPAISVTPDIYGDIAFTLDPKQPPAPLSYQVAVNRAAEAETPLKITATPETSDGLAWLSTDLGVASESPCLDNPIPCGFQFTVSPPAQPGQYWGVLIIAGDDYADRVAVRVTVSGPPPPPPLYYAEPRTVTLSAPVGSRTLVAANVNLLGGAQGTPFRIVREDPWLQVVTSGSSWPATLNVAANPVGLEPGTYTDIIRVRHMDTDELLVSIPVTLNVVAPRFISTLIDGGGWRSAIYLINPEPREARFQLQFWNGTGQGSALQRADALTVSLSERGRDSKVGWETIPPLGMRIIETTGDDLTTRQGWAELSSDGSVSAFGVLRQTKRITGRYPPTDAVLPLLNSFRDRFVVPFDQTGTEVNAVAISNAEDEPVTVQICVRNENGVEVAKEKPFTLGPRGYIAFALPDRLLSTKGRRGVVDFSGEGGRMFAVGVRFTNNGGFIAYPGYPSAERGADRGVPHFAFGGEWQSTVQLTNSTAVAQTGNLRFFQEERGARLAVPMAGDTLRRDEVARVVPGNGMLELSTNGAQRTTDIGWMETRFQKQIGGWVVMRRNFDGTSTSPVEEYESAVHANFGMLGKLAMAFDNRAGYSTRIVLVNTEDTPTEIQTVLYDAQGRFPRYSDSFRLPGKGQYSFNVTDRWESLAGQQGIVEFFSRHSNRITGTALRFGPGAPTVFPAFEK